MGDHFPPGTSRTRRAGAAVGGVAASAGRAAGRRVSALFSAGGEAFKDLAVAHAGSAAGDGLVALALAGTLFFGVPSAEARGNVALYLLITLAPFAVIGPVLGGLLTRFPHAYRHSLVAAAGLRAAIAVLVIGQTDTLWLFPLAFALLVLGRTHGISRNSLLPVVLEGPLALVAANAKMALIGILAALTAMPFGAAGLALVGPDVPLAMAALAYVVSALSGRLLPAPPSRPRAARTTGGARPVPRLPYRVRLALLATAGVRFLNGFLLLLLAFAFHDTATPFADFGALLGAAGAGYGIASLISPWLNQRLKEEPTVLAALAMEAGAAFVAAQWFGLATAAALAATAGIAWGTAKLAFDGLLQAALPPAARGVAFTRSETLLQLVWVVGAVIPTAIPLPADVGLVIAGLAALGAQVVYVGALLLPSEVAAGGPEPTEGRPEGAPTYRGAVSAPEPPTPRRTRGGP